MQDFVKKTFEKSNSNSGNRILTHEHKCLTIEIRSDIKCECSWDSTLDSATKQRAVCVYYRTYVFVIVGEEGRVIHPLPSTRNVNIAHYCVLQLC